MDGGMDTHEIGGSRVLGPKVWNSLLGCATGFEILNNGILDHAKRKDCRSVDRKATEIPTEGKGSGVAGKGSETERVLTGLRTDLVTPCTGELVLGTTLRFPRAAKVFASVSGAPTPYVTTSPCTN